MCVSFTFMKKIYCWLFAFLSSFSFWEAASADDEKTEEIYPKFTPGLGKRAFETFTASATALGKLDGKKCCNFLLKLREEVCGDEKSEKEIVIFYGPSQAGKSTTINYLMGHRFRQSYKIRKDKRFPGGVRKDKIGGLELVKEKIILEEDKEIPLAPMGDGGMSVTFSSKIYDKASEYFCYCDLEGVRGAFRDREERAVEVFSPYFITKVNRVKAIGITINIKSMSLAGGEVFRDTFLALGEYFNPPVEETSDNLRKLGESVFLIITHAEPFSKDSSKDIREELEDKVMDALIKARKRLSQDIKYAASSQEKLRLANVMNWIMFFVEGSMYHEMELRYDRVLFAFPTDDGQSAEKMKEAFKGAPGIPSQILAPFNTPIADQLTDSLMITVNQIIEKKEEMDILENSIDRYKEHLFERDSDKREKEREQECWEMKTLVEDLRKDDTLVRVFHRKIYKKNPSHGLSDRSSFSPLTWIWGRSLEMKELIIYNGKEVPSVCKIKVEYKEDGDFSIMSPEQEKIKRENKERLEHKPGFVKLECDVTPHLPVHDYRFSYTSKKGDHICLDIDLFVKKCDHSSTHEEIRLKERKIRSHEFHLKSRSDMKISLEEEEKNITILKKTISKEYGRYALLFDLWMKNFLEHDPIKKNRMEKSYQILLNHKEIFEEGLRSSSFVASFSSEDK